VIKAKDEVLRMLNNIISMKSMVFLQPIDIVDPEVLSFLKDSLASIWPVTIKNPIDIPMKAYNKWRNQYDGSALLDALLENEGVALGITEVDAYVEGLNFIFGLASTRKALISLMRLMPEFYGLTEDKDLLNQRALKEAVHELGHVFGLDHCPVKRCVMHFSNSILDTDFKDWKFCESCKRHSVISREKID
jgi:archaemetzincin